MPHPTDFTRYLAVLTHGAVQHDAHVRLHHDLNVQIANLDAKLAAYRAHRAALKLAVA